MLTFIRCAWYRRPQESNLFGQTNMHGVKTQAAVKVYVNKRSHIFVWEHKRRGFRQAERYERRRKWWFGITGNPPDPVRETPHTVGS